MNDVQLLLGAAAMLSAQAESLVKLNLNQTSSDVQLVTKTKRMEKSNASKH